MRPVSAYIAVALVVASAVLPYTVAASPSLNRMLNYQLRLTDPNGIPVADGAKNLKLTIYDASSGGTQLYTACSADGSATGTPTAVQVTFTSGTGSTLIGSTSVTCASGSAVAIPATLFNADQAWLGVTVDADAEMTPRKRIVASAYSLNADRLDDLETSSTGGTNAFVPVTDSSGNFTLTQNVTVDTNTFFVDSANNRVSVGTLTPPGELQVASSSTTNTHRGIMSSQHSDSIHAAQMFFRKSRGTNGSPTTVVNGDYIGGYHFQPYVTTSGYIITSSWGARVNGTVTGTSAPTEFFVGTNSVADGDPFTNGSVRLLITSSGNVGIGDTTPDALLSVGPTSQFQVDGSGNVTTSGDVAVNGGDLTTTAATGALFNTNVTTVNVGGAATTLNLAGGSGSTGCTIDGSGNLTCAGAVSGSSATTLQASYDNDVDGGDVTITTNATDGDIIFAGDQDFRVTTTGNSIFDTSTLVVDAANNRIGIGDTTPDVLLDVEATTDAAIGVTLANLSTGTSAEANLQAQSDTAAINVHAYGSGRTGTISGEALADAVALRSTASIPASRMFVGSGSSVPLHLITNDTIGLTLTTAQRVGIGTVSPSSLLTMVSGIGEASGGIFNRAANNSYLILSGGSAATAGSQIAFLDFQLNDTLEANLAVSEATANQPLEINSAVINDVSLVNGGGNVGIGTLAPDAKLDLTSSSTAGTKFFIDNTATTADSQIDFQLSGVSLFSMGVDDSTTNDDFVISDGGALGTTNRLVIDGSTGNATFTANLSVNGNTTIGDAVGDTVTVNGAAWTFVNDTTFALSGGVNGLNFDSNTLSIDATNNRVGLGTAAPTQQLDLVATTVTPFRITSSATDAAIFFDSTASTDYTIGIANAGAGAPLGSFYVYDTGAGTARLLIASGGNVGIGTGLTAATTKLQVDGGTDASLSNGSGYFLIGAESGLNIVFDNNEINARSAGAESVLHLNADGGEVVIHNNQAGGSEVSFEDNGSLGLGTFSPLTKLDVFGNVRATGKATAVLTGSIDPAASTTVTGSGTAFTTQLVVGDRIIVSGETRTVTAIATDTSLTVDAAFSDNVNDTAPDALYAVATFRTNTPNTAVAVNDLGHLVPGLDDTYDLGSNTLRWRDLYLGPATLRIGTAIGDEGTISYNTTTNVLNIDSTGIVDINGGSGSTGCSVDSSGNFACSGTVSGGGAGAFSDGGNSFGAAATLGTNDGFDLNFETTGVTRMTITAAGAATFTTGAATDLFNLLSGNLKVGNGSPSLALDGEDAYIEGTFEADGPARFDNTLNANGIMNLGDGGDTGAIDTSDWDISTSGVMTGVSGITNDGNYAQTAGTFAVTLTTTGAAAFGSTTALTDTISIKPQTNTAATAFNGQITSADLTTAQTWTFPDATGTVVLSSGSALFTLSASAGTNQTISSGETVIIAAGTNIATSVGATDTVTVSTVANPTFSTSVTTPLVTNSGADLAFTTTASGNITATPAAAAGLVNILSGNLKVGDAAPTNALDGEDAFVEGGFEVDGSSRLDGATAINGALTTGSTTAFAAASNVSKASGAGTFSFSTSTATNGIVLTNTGATTTTNVGISLTSSASTGRGVGVTANSLSSGIANLIQSSAAFTGDLLNLSATGAATGNAINITSTSATATARAINIDLDNGDVNNDVIVLTTDEATVSGTAADTVKFRVRASGEVRSIVGFTAGAASTNYRDGSITRTDAGNFSIDTTTGTLGLNSVNNQPVTTGTGLLTVSGDVTVNGGDLTTNQTTFNLIDTTATTLNVGGAATTLNLAGGSGSSGCTVDGSGNLSCTGTIGSGGTLFILAGTSGLNQTVSQGDTVTIAAGTNITTTGSATDTVTVATVANPTFSTSVTTPLVTNAGADLALSTTISGNITATTAAAAGLVNVLIGNLKIGDGVPTVALDGEDAYVEGALEVDGGSNLAGTTTLPGLTASRFAVTNASQQLASSAASADLAATLTNETGTGVAVFGTSPTITTSLISSGATFALANTASTTINFAGAATTLNIGAATGTATINNATVTLANATALNINGASPSIATTSIGTASVFDTNATTVNVGGASTTLNLAGGSGSTGCTVDGSGNLSCTGTIGSGGTLFVLAGSSGLNQTISQGDTVTIAAGTNITTTGAATDTMTVAVVDAPTFSGLVTGQLGLTVSGAAVSLNDSSNFAVSIAGGTSTGQVDVGTGASTQALNFGTGAGPKTVTVGSTDTTSSLTLEAGTGALNVGTGAFAKTITIGNATGATSVVVNGGTGAMSFGANAIAHTVTIGNTTTTSTLALNSGTGGGAYATTENTGNALAFTADSISTGNGINMSVDALTSGTAVAVASTNNSTFNGELLTLTKTGTTGTTAFTSDIANIAYSQTFNAASTLDSTGNVLDISRAITTNNASQNHTVSGALMTLADSGTVTLGTLTSTADVLNIAQNYATNTGAALNVTTAGTGAIFRANDDGTLTDTTPFVIDDNGFVGVGTSAPAYDIDVARSDTVGTPIIGVNNTSTATQSYSAVLVGANNGTVDGIILSDGLGTNFGTPLIAIGSYSMHPIDLVIGGIEAVRINTTNNVGIGTSTTGARLTVHNGSAGTIFAIRNTTDAADTFTVTDTGLVTAADDLAVNGGDITTSAATGNLFNTNATTVNVGGAATTLNLAGGSGSTGCTIDGSGNLACSGSIAGAGGQAFVNGGNSFGGAATLGTNDANSLSFETGGVTYLTIASGGAYSYAGGTYAINDNSNFAVSIAGGTSTGQVDVGTGASTQTLNFGTGAGVKTVTVGSTNTTSSLTLEAGTGALNVGTGAAAKTITIGNTTGATSVVVTGGTGAMSFGAQAVAHTTTVGSATGASATTVQSGTGTLTLSSTATTGTGITGTVNSVNSGNGMVLNANALTTGTALAIGSTNATTFNGELLTLSKTGTTGTTAFTSDIANIAYSQTFNAASTLDSTGNVLDISRAITTNNASQNHTVSGALMTLADSGTVTLGTLTHTANVLAVSQNYSAATGAVVNIQNAGTGFDIVGNNNAWRIAKTGQLLIDPTTTGSFIDLNLETEWTGGTLVNADFASATSQTADVVGALLDFQNNFTGAEDRDFTGMNVRGPALTQSTAALTTNYRMYNVSATGAMTQNATSGTVDWRGLNVLMPQMVSGIGSTGTFESYGVVVTPGGTSISGVTPRVVGFMFNSGVNGGTVVGLDLNNGGAGGVDNAIEIAAGWDTDIIFEDTAARMTIANTGNLSIRDDAGNTLLTVTDAGAVGDVTVSNDLTVTGGDLITGSATSNLFNTVATTLNVGQAATTLSIGATTGTATIRNATVTLSAATTLNINGASPSIVTSSTGTASVFNTNAATVNVGGAATTLNLAGGSASTGCTVDASGNFTCSGSISGAADSLDYDDFEDTMDLDASLTLNQGTNGWTQNSTATGAGTATGYNYNSMDTGQGFRVASTSTALSSGVLFGVDHSATYTATTTRNGNTALFNRDLTINGAGQTLTVSAPVMSISDNGTLTAGTLTHNADVLRLTQSAGAATGNILNIFSPTAAATAKAINIDLDNGDVNNDVIVLTTDEATVSGTAADTVKFRVTASGEAFSDVGFTAGGATTNYRDGSIQSTGTMSINTTSGAAITTGTGLLTAGGALTVTGTATLNGVATIGDGGDAASINSSDWDISATGVMTGISGITSDGNFSQTAGTFSISGTGAVSLGGGSQTVAVNSNDWDISTAGAMTGIGAITMDGNFSQTGATTFSTGSGANSLNGDVTIASGRNLTLASGTGRYSQTYTDSTSDAFTIATSALTSGRALVVNSSSNSFTGNMVVFDRTSAGSGTNHNGNLVDINFDVTTTSNAGSHAGKILEISRNNVNNSGASHTFSGAVMTLSDAASIVSGGITHSASVLEITQGYTSNTGSALNLTTAGTGFAFRANDDGTLTDSTPFVITAAGFVGIGETTPENLFSVDGTAFIDGSTVHGGTGSAILTVDGASGTDIVEFRDFNAVSRFVLESDGRVGISDSTPDGFLDVEGQTSNVDAVSIRHDTLATPASGLRVETTTTNLDTSADLVDITQTSTFGAADTNTGALLEVHRNITATAGATTNGGAMILMQSDLTQAGGTFTDTSDLLQINSNFTGNTGDALEVTYAGTGFALRVNDVSGDTTPFVIDDNGAVGFGTTSINSAAMAHFANSDWASTNVLISGLTGSVVGPTLSIDNSAATSGEKWDIISTGTGAAAPVGSLGFWNDTDGAYRLVLAGDGNVGVGESGTPDTRLHVTKGSAGSVTGNGNSIAVFENSTNGYIHLLTPAANEQGILFGDPTDSISGGIILNASNEMEFRAGGNANKMIIGSTGNVRVFGPATGQVSFDIGPNDTALNDGPTRLGLYESNTMDCGFRIEYDGVTTNELQFQGGCTSFTAFLSIPRGGGTIDAQANIQLEMTGTATTNGVCHSGADVDVAPANDRSLVVCSAAPGDVAEWYETTGGAGPGDIMATTGVILTYDTDKSDAASGMIVGTETLQSAILEKSTDAYDARIVGVISSSPAQTYGKGLMDEAQYEQPIAVAGRVPVKVNLEGGQILPGDPISASTVPGVGMKATKPGMVVGFALNSWSGPGQGSILVFVSTGFYGAATIGSDGNATTFTDDIAFGKKSAATSADSAKGSRVLSFRGSSWQNSSVGAVNRDISVANVITSKEEYKLSITNDTDDEIAYFGHNGDLAISGRLFPSDRGELQTSKYIYYDGSNGSGGNRMRTNAAGWGTGSFDFAEMFPSDDTLEAGELVMVDTRSSTKMRRAVGGREDAPAYLLAGIVSTEPGYLAGMNEVGQYPVALEGRVPTRVVGPVKIGEPITVSLTDGVGMAATEPTYIVGIALEAKPDIGPGTVMVFVKTGWWNGSGVVESNTAVSQAPASPQLGFMTSNLDMAGYAITTVGAVSGINNIWSIDGNGVFKTRETYATDIQTDTGPVTAYATQSQKVELTASGNGQLTDGVAAIAFDEAFRNVISGGTPLKVIVTLTSGEAVGVYVTDKSIQGFTVRELGGGTSAATFDWMVIARRKGFDDPIVEPPPASVEEPPSPAEPPPAGAEEETSGESTGSPSGLSEPPAETEASSTEPITETTTVP